MLISTEVHQKKYHCHSKNISNISQLSDYLLVITAFTNLETLSTKVSRE